MCDVKLFLTFASLGLVLLWQLFYLFCSSIVINTVIVIGHVDQSLIINIFIYKLMGYVGGIWIHWYFYTLVPVVRISVLIWNLLIIVPETWAILCTTGDKDEPNIVLWRNRKIPWWFIQKFQMSNNDTNSISTP
jgi:hypothetical protein